MGRYYTQIDGATIGGTDSGSITDIFGAIVIDKKIKESCPWTTDTYMRYRDDTFEASNDAIETEVEKTEWMNDNIDERIRFTDNLKNGVERKTTFMDIATQVGKDKDGENKIMTSTYSKPTDTHQYLSPKSCHPQQQTRHIPYGVIHRIRRNASDRVPGDEVFKEQAVEYKSYLLKSGYDDKEIDDQFAKILKFKRNTILYKERKKKKQKDKTRIRFITDYEPAFPSINGVIKSMEDKIKNSPLLSRMLPEGAKNVQVSMRRGGKNIKEILATTKLNCREERLARTGKCGPCNRPCVHCILLSASEGTTFTSTVTKRTYKIRQIVNCTSKMVVYLITCIKCYIQGVGSTDVFYTRMGNYKTNITKKRGSCGIENHFKECGHSFADFKVQIIAQVENVSTNRKAAFKRLREFEGYWQMELCTMEPTGMNTNDEFHRNTYAQEKASFHPLGSGIMDSVKRKGR